ncbi:hypothetical protein Gotri_019516, partial [Gossypium trilobum]|nr:hypothetical protein [Gossypium trilobum]
MLGDSGQKFRRDGFGFENDYQQSRTYSFAAEALACLQTIQVVLDLGYRDVVIEGDSRTIVKKLHAQNEDGSVISAYITDAKSLSEICDTCIFKHV